MKRNIFAVLVLFFMLFVTETNAQRRGYRYRYVPPRPYIRVVPRIIVPRIVVPPPAIGFSWGYRPRVYVVPPPIIIGGGMGWRHYHRRGYDCNGRCHRWSDDNYYRDRDRRHYDDRRYRDEYDNRDRRYYDDRDRRYNDEDRNRRYNDNDRHYNRLENNQKSSPKTYNTDEDSFEEETHTI